MTRQGGTAVLIWAPHSICTQHFAQRLQAPCYLIHYLRLNRPLLAPIKYIPMCLKTWAVLLKQRPSAVFVVNTPVFAPLTVHAYCRLARIPYVMNVHGHSFIGWKWGWSRPLMRALARRALVNIVGFQEYRQLFEAWGARALILEDPLPSISSEKRELTTRPGEFNVTVISTFAADEPLHLVLGAARLIPDVHCYILGDTALADRRMLDSAPGNVTFTGYLKGDAYWNQLFSSQALMTLTTTPRSLVAGGLEGMIVGKPLILSRQPVLVDYFTKGTVFVDHTVESIAEGIQQARECEATLAQEVAELAVEKRERWEETFEELLDLLGDA